MSWDQYPPPIGNPQNADLKVGDLIFIKNQLLTQSLMQNTNQVIAP